MQVSKLCFNILVDQILGDVNLSQGQLVMVLVIQDVHQVGVERVDVLQKQTKHNWESDKSPNSLDRRLFEVTYIKLWEVGENLREAVVVVLLRELHLAHVKMSDAVNLVMFVDNCGRLPLCFG